MAAEQATPAAEAAQAFEHPYRVRNFIAKTAIVVGCGVAGAIGGAEAGLHTPAHLEVAGSDTTVQLQLGHNYDQLDLDDILIAKRATTRTELGEPLGVHVHMNVDPASFQDASGNFNPNTLPAYTQLFSDPTQLETDATWAVEKHLLLDIGGGLTLGLLAGASPFLYRRARQAYDEIRGISPEERSVAHDYHRPERRLAKTVATGMVLTAAINGISSSAYSPPAPKHIVGDPLLAGTPFAGVEIDGLAKPAVTYIQNYIEQYVNQTNKYYTSLNKLTTDYLATEPVTLPSGDNIVNVGFVTDRHCNIGMDRVVMTVMNHYGIKLLLSGGDDDFSGSFSFEAACTGDLAEKLKKAHITELEVPGNHDSAMTIADEKQQGIKVMQDKVVSVDGLNFLGEPDPRTSRYGQKIRPFSNEAQLALVDLQGGKIGKLACQSDKKIIALLHDPVAGNKALETGCGNVTLALDGHTHVQTGPTDISLPKGYGYQFVGGSSGGAPSDGEIETNFQSSITVGPLQHDATINIASIYSKTGQLVAMTEFQFTPSQEVSSTQQVVQPDYIVQPPLTRTPVAQPTR